MALNTKRPAPRKPRTEAEEAAAFERVVGAAPDAPAKPKPGPKAGSSYGLGIATKNVGRRQLTVTFPVEVLERLNRVAERTHHQRAGLIVLAVQRLLDGDDPTFSDRG